MPQYLFETPVGAIQTHQRGTVCEALGIPYARAPRFAYPHPIAARDFADPYVADQPAPAAPQRIRGKGSGDIRQSAYVSEDCQNLSIIMPADIDPEEHLPVMVYFHGGSYVVGSGDGARYNPDALINEHRVVIVRVTYRLGILGFLGGSQDRPANLGLLDAREALRWVKHNIASFGGDPANITAFGQSAGGDLVACLLISDGVLEENLLQRAIIQSAPLDLIFGKERMAKHMLADIERQLAPDSPWEDYGKLGYKMQFQNPLRFGLDRSMMAFGTQLGYYPLPKPEDLDAAYARAASRVQVLIGSNLRESAYFTPRKLSSRAMRALEPVVRNFSWRMYAAPAQRFVERHRAAGGKATRYYLRTGNPLHNWYSAHCTELPLLFDNPAWAGSRYFAGAYRHEYKGQAHALRAIWAGFARTGEVAEDLAQAGRIEFS